MKKIVDLHMHVVPQIDDGSQSLLDSIEMIKLSLYQGVTDIFCTSHNGYSLEDGEKYRINFNLLKEQIKKADMKINLHKGSELLCASEYVDDILYGLKVGAFSTLGDTNYVLVELYSDARPSEALYVIDKFVQSGYKPVIAHMERNYNITGFIVNTLIHRGALIQVNATSFNNKTDISIQNRARELLKNHYVHFIGSDAHNLECRSPIILPGIDYIFNNVDEKYATEIVNGTYMN